MDDVIALESGRTENGMPTVNNDLDMKRTVKQYNSKRSYCVTEHNKNRLDLIQKSNPMLDDYHTGICSVDDTFLLKRQIKRLTEIRQRFTKNRRKFIQNSNRYTKICELFSCFAKSL